MKQRFAAVGFSYLSGLLCASFLSVFVGLTGCAILLAASLVVYLLKKYSAGIVLFALAAGIGVYSLYSMLFVAPVRVYDGQTVTLSGKVEEKSVPANDTARYTVSAVIGGVPAKVTFFASDTDADYDDFISCEAKLYTPVPNVDFDEYGYYLSKGITMKASVRGNITVEKNNAFSLIKCINSFSGYIGDRISSYLPNQEGALLRAIFLGDKSALSYQTEEDITNCGLNHVTAVSGLHLTMIAHILMCILNLFGLRYRAKTRFVVLFVLILAFTVFFRLSPSVIRSGIMLIVYYGAELFMRKGSAVNSIGFALLILLIPAPYACRDIGLLLSVAGTFGVGVIAPEISRHFRENRFLKIKETVTGTLCACYCTLPFSAIYFGGISLVGAVSNIVILPLFYVALACVLFFTFCGGYSNAAMYVSGMCMKAALAVMDFLGGLDFAYISLEYDFIPAFLLISGVFLTVVWLCFRDFIKTAKAAALTVCMLAALIIAENFAATRQVRISAYSDGTDGVVYISDGYDYIVVATDINEKIADNIKQYASRNLFRTNAVFVLTDSGNNALYLADGIKARKVILPDDEVSADYTVGENMTLSVHDGYTTVELYGTTVCVTKVRTVVPESDIMFFNGYTMSRYDGNGAVNVFFNKRQDFCGINAYYEEFDILLRYK